MGLANKCAIASRVDCFSVDPTPKFGEALKDQVEERLKFLASGTKPRKNKEAMDEVLKELKADGLFYGDKVQVAKEHQSDAEDSDDVDMKTDSKKKAKVADSDDEESDDVAEKKRDKKNKDKKDKKDKKSKKAKESSDEEESDSEVEKSKKKDKKRQKK